MAVLLPLSFVLALTIAANVAEKSGNPSTKRAYSRTLIILNTPLLLLGFVLILSPQENLDSWQDFGIPQFNLGDLGWVFVAMGVWGLLCCITSFRRFLARLAPFDAESSVHLTALVLAGYLVGNTALAISQDFLLQLPDAQIAVSIVDILLQQIAFVAFAFTGAGLFIRRDVTNVNRRLGLFKPTWTQLGIGLAVIAMLILIQGTIGALWALVNPEQAAELGNINDALLSGFDTAGEWFILAIASGFGEELLFRGALQPVFGLPITSLLFAVVHIQYGLTPITLAVFLLGLILGFVRHYTNTSVAIFVHFGYNFALGLLSMLVLFLERVVTP